MGIIQLLLLPFQLSIHILFQLIRQVLQYILFQPAEHKRPNQLLQLFHRLFIAALYHGNLDAFPETLISIQKPRHQIVKNAPQFTQPVFHRRAGKRQLESRLNLLHRLRCLSIMVLDILGFVNNLTVKPDSFIVFNIPPQQVVRGQQNIPLPGIQYDFLPFHCRPGHGLHMQRRGKPLNFAAPVIYQRGRRHNQASFVFPGSRINIFGQQESNYLQCFSQPHVVRQYPAEPVALQGFNPKETFFLIFPHNIFQTGRNLKVIVLHRLHIPHQFLEIPVFYRTEGRIGLQFPVQIQCPELRQHNAVLFQLPVRNTHFVL